MENNSLSKNTIAFGLALALASVVNAALVVIKESSPAVQTGMQKLTGHHWITHSAIVLGLFFLCGGLFGRLNGGGGIKLTVNRFLGLMITGVVLGGLIIVGFYLVGD
jgi:hypothetical protein